MGLRDESDRLGGWYDGYNYYTYEELNYDTSACNEIAIETIKTRLREFIDSPKYMLRFFRQKIESTWCDPLFQSIWSGSLPSLNQELKNEKLSSLYQEGIVNDTVKNYCGGWLLMAYVMLSIFCIMVIKQRDSNIPLIGLIFFIGGFLFYLVWETKSQYTYPYIFVMIPYIACSIDYCFSVIFRNGFIKQRY